MPGVAPKVLRAGPVPLAWQAEQKKPQKSPCLKSGGIDQNPYNIQNTRT